MWLTIVIAALYLWGYAFDVHKRTTREPACQWIEVPNRDAMPYAARWCKLTKDTVLLRLYAANADQVLAERMFFHLDRPTFCWEAGEFGYATSPDGGVISLPPTLLDRVRARLP